MKIFVNNNEILTDSETLADFAAEYNLPQRGIAVAVCNKMVPRTEWQSFRLADEQRITVIKAFCGG